MIRSLFVAAMCVGLTVCGDGSGRDDGGDDFDPAVYKEKTPGKGSTVVDAEVAVTQGAINYSHYQLHNASMNDKSWKTQSVLATVNFNATSNAGSIQFPVLGGTATVSTSDGQATASWTGPFKASLYKLNGNMLNPESWGGALIDGKYFCRQRVPVWKKWSQ